MVWQIIHVTLLMSETEKVGERFLPRIPARFFRMHNHATLYFSINPLRIDAGFIQILAVCIV